jgi:hypothetical protein
LEGPQYNTTHNHSNAYNKIYYTTFRMHTIHYILKASNRIYYKSFRKHAIKYHSSKAHNTVHIPSFESTLLSKISAVYFICSDDANSSKSYQRSFARNVLLKHSNLLQFKWMQQVSLKHWYLSAQLHGSISKQKLDLIRS